MIETTLYLILKSIPNIDLYNWKIIYIKCFRCVVKPVRFRNIPTAYRRCKTRNPKRPFGNVSDVLLKFH